LRAGGGKEVEEAERQLEGPVVKVVEGKVRGGLA
jgi:hypothetical protein